MNDVKLRKITKVLYLLIVFVCIFICTWLSVKTVKTISDYRQNAKAQKEKEYRENLENLYERETYAFGMGMSKEYQGFDSVDIRQLILQLALYEDQKPDASKVTIDEIQTFLSSEYDDNGNLRVLNQPENISEYVDWYCYEGASHFDDYKSFLRGYAADHPEKYQNIFLFNMDLEMLYELIDDYRDCPNKEKYGPNQD